MSALVSPISSNPRSRISRLVKLLVERHRAIVAKEQLAAIAEQEQLAALDTYREHLPIDHEYRHMLDTVDVACARMVCAPTEICSCPPNGGTQ